MPLKRELPQYMVPSYELFRILSVKKTRRRGFLTRAPRQRHSQPLGHRTPPLCAGQPSPRARDRLHAAQMSQQSRENAARAEQVKHMLATSGRVDDEEDDDDPSFLPCVAAALANALANALVMLLPRRCGITL